MPFEFLWRWFARRPRQRPDLCFLLYTRAACPLCDKAWELLVRYQRRYGFTLQARDIGESPDLVRAHGEWVPVVSINGRVRFRGQINEVLLRRMLEAASGP